MKFCNSIPFHIFAFMKQIAESFLKSKHWVLFTLGYGIQIVFYLIMIPKSFHHPLSADPQEQFVQTMSIFRMFGPMMILMSLIIYGWIWSIVNALYDKLPPFAGINLQKFNFIFGLAFFYVMALSIFLSWYFGNTDFIEMIDKPDFRPSVFITSFLFIFVLHILAMVAIFYSIYVAAKTVKTIELQRKVSFSDFVAEFFLIWFFPVGIWILQPRLNRYVKGEIDYRPKNY